MLRVARFSIAHVLVIFLFALKRASNIHARVQQAQDGDAVAPRKIEGDVRGDLEGADVVRDLIPRQAHARRQAQFR